MRVKKLYDLVQSTLISSVNWKIKTTKEFLLAAKYVSMKRTSYFTSLARTFIFKGTLSPKTIF